MSRLDYLCTTLHLHLHRYRSRSSEEVLCIRIHNSNLVFFVHCGNTVEAHIALRCHCFPVINCIDDGLDIICDVLHFYRSPARKLFAEFIIPILLSKVISGTDGMEL